MTVFERVRLPLPRQLFAPALERGDRMFDVAAYLLGKGLRGRPASGGRELVYPCFFDCQESPDSRKRKLYVNAEEATFQCKICNSSGGSYLLQKHFGDTPRQDSSDEPFVRRQILDWAADLGAEMLANREDVLLYLLDERGLGPETIVERKLGFVGDNWSLTGSLPADFTRDQLATTGLVHRDGPRAGRDFFTSQVLIPIMHRGHALSIRGRAWGQTRGGKYMSGPGEVVRAYNLDSLDGAEEVILTEGEFDAMRLAEVLAQSGEDRAKRIAVVGLPGTNSIPDDLDSYLADIKRIFIGFDADEPGKLGAERMRERYGARARVLALPDKDGKAADWSDFLLPAKDDTAWGFAHPFAGHGASDVLQLMSAASGKRIFSVAEAGSSFRSTRAAHGGLKSGYRELDAVIEPGMLPGQVVFILAKTGCIQGDAEIVVNRGGGAKRMSLRALVEKFNGGGRWDPSIPTYVQREQDGVVRLARLRNAWYSGVKTTYTVTTTTGRQIRATDGHPFLTEHGWRRLDELSVGDGVCVNAGRSTAGRARKVVYSKRTVPAHPHAGRRNVKAGGHSVSYHRLVAEAQLNGWLPDDFVDYLRDPQADITGLMFLDPEIWAVHHIDHNPLNNAPENLKVLTHSEHHELHAAEGKDRHVLERVGLEQIVSVEVYGEEPTYDLEVEDDPHNFLANGFVVHNTGKTLVLCNLAYNMRRHRILFISLEMTREEVYHRLERIYYFHNPLATAAELEYALSTVWICDENRLGEKDIQALVSEYEIENGARPDVVMVDYLGYYARGMKGNTPYEKTTNAAMQLKADAKAGRLVIISPAQVNRGSQDGKPLDLDDARDSGAIEETGDFVLSVYRPEAALSAGQTAENVRPSGTLRMSILKSRHGGVGRTFSLAMDMLTLAIVDAGSPKAKTVEDHNYKHWRALTWDELRAQQTAPRQLAMGGDH